MRLRPTGWLSWQLALLLLLTLVCGGVVGMLGATITYLQEAEPIARELSRKTTRIALLEMLVQQQVPDSYDSLEASPAADAAGVLHAVGRLHAQPAAATAPPVAVLKPAAPHSARSAPQVVAVRPTRPAVAEVLLPETASAPAAPAAAPELRPEPVAAVTGEELLMAMKGRIEGVSGEKAGVKGVEKGAVLLRNGGVIRVGQLFPSGEKLLQVDPENNRVITNKRQMLLFFPN